MSSATPTPTPGLRNQTGVRTGLRILGGLLALAGFGFMLVAGIDFFTLETWEEPTKFWMFFVGLPCAGIGMMMLQAGFAGAGARYAAGEYAPVVKDAAAYLTDGKGVLNVGATGATRAAGEGESTAGPYCRSCGTRNDADARFCDGCGTAMA